MISFIPCSPHVVIFSEESIVLHCPLLELHIYAAAVDADDASDAAAGRTRAKRQRHRQTFTFSACLDYSGCKTWETQVSESFWSAGGPAVTRGFPYSTFSVMRVLSFMVAVRAKPLVVGDDMCDCRTVSKASRTLSSVT